VTVFLNWAPMVSAERLRLLAKLSETDSSALFEKLPLS
jgi:hypothetical protein